MLEVSNGISLLDQKGPRDWALWVNLDRLNLAHERTCILGQLYGSYSKGQKRLGVKGSARVFGFLFLTPWGYRRAERQWRREITVRQDAHRERLAEERRWRAFNQQLEEWRASVPA